MKKYSEDFILKNQDLFYLLPNGTYFPYLKEDVQLAIDNNIPFTYIPILEAMDIPYIPMQWNSLIDKYGDKPIISRYVAKMKLATYKNMRFADSEKLINNELVTIIFNNEGDPVPVEIDKISIRSTSSNYYPIKNYKIKF